MYFRDELGVSAVMVAHDARRTGPQYLSLAAECIGPLGSKWFIWGASVAHPTSITPPCVIRITPRSCSAPPIIRPATRARRSSAPTWPPSPRVSAAGRFGEDQGIVPCRHFANSGRRSSGLRLDGDYVDYSMSLAGVGPGGLRGRRLLQDYLFGAAGREMMLAFELAEADLEPLHFVADGDFPLGDPNPVKQNVVREGLERLRTGEFAWGAFFDGDGDRIDVYGGDGVYLASSFLYAAMLPLIRQRFSGEGLGVFADLKSNPLAIIEMARTGVTVDVIRNGHSQIKQSLVDDPTRLGAVEESAHFYEAFYLGDSPRFCTENTLYIALLAARTWREQPQRVQAMFELQATTAREREWGYKFPSDQQRDDALRGGPRAFRVARGTLDDADEKWHGVGSHADAPRPAVRRGTRDETGPGLAADMPADLAERRPAGTLGSVGSGPAACAGSEAGHRGVRQRVRCGERVSRLGETTMYALDWRP